MVVSHERVRDFVIPPGTDRLEGVYVNGVRQVEGRDFLIDGDRLRFVGSLRRRRPLSLGHHLLVALCASVDEGGDDVAAIAVRRGGRASVSLQPA